MRPTDDELRALLELEAKASQKDWRISSNPKQWVEIPAPQEQVRSNRDNDAALVVASRNRIRAIVEELLERREADRNADSRAAELKRWNGEE